MKKIQNSRFSFFLVMATLILTGCSESDQTVTNDSENLLINQIGYAVDGPKKALSKLESNTFTLINTGGEVVFEGNAKPSKTWELSGDHVSELDFSAFNENGTYRICVGNECSYSFRIGTGLFSDLADASLKSYYYARCSEAIPAKYGGKWSREAGHPDTAVYIHASAASTSRPEGATIASPGGWYDAGDYGKYIVNSSITTWTLLKSLDLHGGYHANQNLNIPESGNDLPDILDEVLVNLRWMLSMQDPADGGVYHKLTTKGFDAFILPAETSKERYVVQKSTSAALDFAATMAFAARVMRKYDLESLAEQMTQAAEKAWQWSRRNGEIFYEQPEDISTGAYPDTSYVDEWFWAAAELYLTTNDVSYKAGIEEHYTASVTPKWDVVQALGAISLVTSNQAEEFESIRNDFIAYADQMLAQEAACPYLISMNKFAWGSNSDVGNDGMLKIIAHQITGDQKYLLSAQNDLDYILGRNATGYSFVTGFGSRTPQVPHNRIISADGVEAPIPGYIVGGPNIIVLNDCEPIKVERAPFPATSYVDVECSYSTNETAINWNAPLVFLASGLSAAENEYNEKL